MPLGRGGPEKNLNCQRALTSFSNCARSILETLAGYPDYLAFFNLPSGGSRGGLSLLGDSNLDWGQDLPALADWQRQHPEPTLYLSYSGTADPAAYGIRYINLPGGYPYGPPPQSPRQPGVIAIDPPPPGSSRLPPGAWPCRVWPKREH